MHDRAMVALFPSLVGALRSALRTRTDLALENLVLRLLDGHGTCYVPSLVLAELLPCSITRRMAASAPNAGL